MLQHVRELALTKGGETATEDRLPGVWPLAEVRGQPSRFQSVPINIKGPEKGRRIAFQVTRLWGTGPHLMSHCAELKSYLL